MEATTTTQIKALRQEIIELKLSTPYSSLIRAKNQELDRLIESNKV
tara:strand:- start:356 stop:493 length:138 start_codon:yes stop_codon:yes gene_type:complete